MRAIDAEVGRPDAEIDVLRISLWMAKHLEPETDVEGVLRDVDHLASIARPHVDRVDGLVAKAAALSRFLFEEQGLSYVSREAQQQDPLWTAKHRWVSQLLSTRRGHCLSMSMLYAAIADRIGIDAKLVVVPDHFFVRVSDGSTVLNIETTDKGRQASEAEYQARCRYRSGGYYPRVASRKELVGVLLSNHLGYDLVDRGRHDLSLQCNAKALTLCWIDPSIYTNYGVALRALRRPTEALEMYDASLKIDDCSVMAAITWSNRGNVLVDLKRADEASASYDKALQCDPSYSGGLTNKAQMLMKSGRYVEAIELCDAVLKVQPSNHDALVHKATALGNMGRDDEALPLYDRVVTLGTRDPVVYSNRANSLAELGRFQEALEGYEAALKLNPRFVGALANRGNILGRLGRTDEAMASLDAAIGVDGSDARAWIFKVVVLLKATRVGDALKCVEAAEKRGVRIPEAIVDRVREAAQDK